MTSRDKWDAAQAWVDANQALIEAIAGPYFRYMAADKEDLRHEAILAAYDTLETLLARELAPDRFGAHFRVIYRTRCMRMASGARVTTGFDLDRLPAISPSIIRESETTNNDAIHEAMRVLTRRQRQICSWILSQSRPVSTSQVAEVFGVSDRYVRKILNQSVEQIKETNYATNTNSRVCKKLKNSPKNSVLDARQRLHPRSAYCRRPDKPLPPRRALVSS